MAQAAQLHQLGRLEVAIEHQTSRLHAELYGQLDYMGGGGTLARVRVQLFRFHPPC